MKNEIYHETEKCLCKLEKYMVQQIVMLHETSNYN